MQAIYRGKLHYVTNDTGSGVELDDGTFVSFGNYHLIIDPTDDQVSAARAGEPIPADPDDITAFNDFVDSLPDELDSATKDHIKREYGSSWPRRGAEDDGQL